MHLDPHSSRPRDQLSTAISESDRARAILQSTWMKFEAEPTPARKVELYSAMGAEIDSLLRVEVARRVAAARARGKP